jgi:hypothetical protein
MALTVKKVLLTKKVNNTVYSIFPKTQANIVEYGESNVAAALDQFATDMKNYYTNTETDNAIKKSADDLYNKIMGFTDSDKTIDEAYDTLKEVAAWIDEHGDVAATFTKDISALKTAVGDDNSGLVKGLADAVAAISDNDNDISALQTAVGKLEAAVGDANSGLVKSVADHETRIKALETTVGDANSGLVKDVADLKSVSPTKVEASTTNGNIKIDGTETTVYTHPDTHDADMIVESDSKQFVTKAQKDIIDNAAAVVMITSETEATNENNLYMIELAD